MYTTLLHPANLAAILTIIDAIGEAAQGKRSQLNGVLPIGLDCTSVRRAPINRGHNGGVAAENAAQEGVGGPDT